MSWFTSPGTKSPRSCIPFGMIVWTHRKWWMWHSRSSESGLFKGFTDPSFTRRQLVCRVTKSRLAHHWRIRNRGGEKGPTEEDCGSPANSQHLCFSVRARSLRSSHSWSARFHTTGGTEELSLPYCTQIPSSWNCEQRALWLFGASKIWRGSFSNSISLLKLPNTTAGGF